MIFKIGWMEYKKKYKMIGYAIIFQVPTVYLHSDKQVK